MNVNPQGPSRDQIYQRLDRKSTAELLEIWKNGSRMGWRGAAYEMVGEILQKRLGRPVLQAPSSVPTSRATRIPWLVFLGGGAIMVILALLVFRPHTTKPAAILASTLPGLMDTPSQAASPTSPPTLMPSDTPVFLPSETPAATLSGPSSRPLTGLIMPNQNGSGEGELTVENGTSLDGVVILTLNDSPVMAAYIRSGDTFTLNAIKDGTYYLYFSTGSDWNGKVFVTSPSHKKFQDAFKFTSTASTYTTWSVTLHGVVGGNAAAEDVPPNLFPSLQN
jgi:hypothetical protein